MRRFRVGQLPAMTSYDRFLPKEANKTETGRRVSDIGRARPCGKTIVPPRRYMNSKAAMSGKRPCLGFAPVFTGTFRFM